MRLKQRKILHISPHLGGGVGRVVLNYLSKVKGDPGFIHQVACLDYANANAVEVADRIGLGLSDRMSGKKRQLLAMITGADIVLIHWWNHPLLYDFLVRVKLPPCRIVMWSHISGFNPPYVFTRKIFKYPDLFVFTTPVSYQANEVKSLSEEQKKSLRVVWSTGGVEHVKDVRPKKHKGFNIGYIGTVDYCKLHPDFISICSRVNIPGVKFVVCGGPKEKELRQEVSRLGIADKFNFTGLVPDIAKYFPVFDAFGYPLAPYHYGTCDQALAESMAAGVVPVVLANKMESYMVKDGVTGIVARDQCGYIKALEKLYTDKSLRSILSQNAKVYAVNAFSLETVKLEWDKVFYEVLAVPKTPRKWALNVPGAEISTKDVFLESLGPYGFEFSAFCKASNAKERTCATKKIKKLALSPLWQADTRGTVSHYDEFFPGDRYLSVWAELMRGEKA